jgi:hypothetical protein
MARQGNFIGINTAPTLTGASGIWTLEDNFTYRKNNVWPTRSVFANIPAGKNNFRVGRTATAVDSITNLSQITWLNYGDSVTTTNNLVILTTSIVPNGVNYVSWNASMGSGSANFRYYEVNSDTENTSNVVAPSSGSYGTEWSSFATSTGYPSFYTIGYTTNNAIDGILSAYSSGGNSYTINFNG